MLDQEILPKKRQELDLKVSGKTRKETLKQILLDLQLDLLQSLACNVARRSTRDCICFQERFESIFSITC